MQSFIDSIKAAIESALDNIRASFLDGVISWLYENIMSACQSLFSSMTGMGTELFQLGWVKSALMFFSSFGWMMYISGCALAIFSMAISYLDMGRISLKKNVLPILEGLIATFLFTIVPVALYKACSDLQTTFIAELSRQFMDTDLSMSSAAMKAIGYVGMQYKGKLLLGFVMLLLVIFCIAKVFLANIKRGGILLIQIAVGSLHLFSLPRGITEGFYSWCKQVIALCFTAFLQTSLLYMGLLTFTEVPLVGIGVMLSSCEVHRITKMFGLDTSISLSPAIGRASSIIHMGRMVIH